MIFMCSPAPVVSACAVAILKKLKGQVPLTDLLYGSCVAQAPYYGTLVNQVLDRTMGVWDSAPELILLRFTAVEHWVSRRQSP